MHEHADTVNAVSFGRDGRTILSTGDDQTARICPCGPCAPARTPLSLACARTSRDLAPAELQHYAGGR